VNRVGAKLSPEHQVQIVHAGSATTAPNTQGVPLETGISAAARLDIHDSTANEGGVCPALNFLSWAMKANCCTTKICLAIPKTTMILIATSTGICGPRPLVAHSPLLMAAWVPTPTSRCKGDVKLIPLVLQPRLPV
jgi:hypothetical protein